MTRPLRALGPGPQRGCLCAPSTCLCTPYGIGVRVDALEGRHALLGLALSTLNQVLADSGVQTKPRPRTRRWVFTPPVPRAPSPGQGDSAQPLTPGMKGLRPAAAGLCPGQQVLISLGSPGRSQQHCTLTDGEDRKQKDSRAHTLRAAQFNTDTEGSVAFPCADPRARSKFTSPECPQLTAWPPSTPVLAAQAWPGVLGQLDALLC